MSTYLRWAAEAVGALLIAGAAATVWWPLGLAVLGVYLVVAANVDRTA